MINCILDVCVAQLFLAVELVLRINSLTVRHLHNVQPVLIERESLISHIVSV